MTCTVPYISELFFCFRYTYYKFICYLLLFVFCLFVAVIYLFTRNKFEFSKNRSSVSYFFVYLKPVSLCVLVFLVESELANVDCIARSSPPLVFLRKAVLKICSKVTGEQPCQSVISIKLQNNFIEITLQHVCSPVNLLHIFRTLFHKNTYGGLLLYCVPYIILTKQPGECLKKICS